MIEAKYIPTPYSPEGRIATKLRVLGCAESNFAKLCAGIIGKTKLNEALTDSRRSLDNPTAESLFDRIEQMESLQAAVAVDGVQVPIDWARIEAVSTALSVRLANQIELKSGNHELEFIANTVTKRVTS